MVLGDKPLSQVTFVTCSNHSQVILPDLFLGTKEDRDLRGKLHIVVSQADTLYAKR